MLAHLGEALYQQGRYDEAEIAIAESEAISSPEDVVDRLLQATLKAKLSARRGDLVRAEPAAQEAVAGAADYKLRFVLEDALMGLPEILQLAETMRDNRRSRRSKSARARDSCSAPNTRERFLHVLHRRSATPNVRAPQD